MKNSSAVRFKECICSAAITLILFLISKYVPFMAFPGFFLVGVPMGYVTFKYGLSAGGVTSLLLMFVVWIMPDAGSSLLVYPWLVIPAVSTAFIFEKKGKDGFYLSIVITGVLYFFGFLGVLVAISGKDGVYAFITESMSGMGDMLKTYLGQLQDASGFSLSDKEVSNLLSQAAEEFSVMLPCVFIAFSAVMAYISVRVNVFFAEKFKVTKEKCPTFAEIAAPRFMCGIWILLYIFRFFSNNDSIFYMTVKNLSVITTLAFTVCGLSALDGAFKRKVENGLGRFAVYAAVSIIGFSFVPLMAEFLAFFGFVDTLNGFRRFLLDIRNSKNFKNGGVKFDKNININNLKDLFEGKTEKNINTDKNSTKNEYLKNSVDEEVKDKIKEDINNQNFNQNINQNINVNINDITNTDNTKLKNNNIADGNSDDSELD